MTTTIYEMAQEMNVTLTKLSKLTERKKMPTKTLQELALEYFNMFESKTRENGDKFWCVRDEFTYYSGYHHSPLGKLIFQAHRDMMPNDYKYQFIVDSLQALADYDNPDDIHLEPDVYNRELLEWVGSHLGRAYYVDEAIEENGYSDFYTALGIGQVREKEEVLFIVRQALEELL